MKRRASPVPVGQGVPPSQPNGSYDERLQGQGQTNDIPQRQNREDAIELLQAKCAAYDRAQHVMYARVIVAAVLPAVLTVLLFADQVWSPLAMLITLAVLVGEPFVAEPYEERLRVEGARFQEQFDCSVLDMPWNTERHGEPPSKEEIILMAHRYRPRPGAPVYNWYPVEVGQIPRAPARLLCQRANGWWDSNMRERYANHLAMLLIAIVVPVIAAGVMLNQSALEVIAIVCALAPLISWSTREMRSQRKDAAARSTILHRADALWALATRGEVTPEELGRSSRSLQNDIFDQRRSARPPIGWAYSRYRDADESAMCAGAEQRVTMYMRARDALLAPEQTA